MNIMVFDVPATTGGALSVLDEFYKEVTKIKEKKINWIFVISTPQFEETENIKIKRFPWIKKSWFHRLYFDQMVAPRLIKKYQPDKVVSFQNIIIPHTKAKQILYMHNPLPFVDYKFSFRENKLMWVYQNIIGKKIISSIKRADRVIVQTEWIKEACIKKGKISENKINVIAPKVDVDNAKSFIPEKESFTTFFYPASGMEYKNHQIIVQACQELRKKNVKDYKVIFTLNGKETESIEKLFETVVENELPIEFVGDLDRKKVFDLYTKSILLFPSYIETFGLPMLEARLHKSIVMASKCPFSREILEGYANAYYFDPFDPKELFSLLHLAINQEIEYDSESDFQPVNIDCISTLELIIN